ncbi:MAG TPA: hypothetical protein VFE37_25280 [Chloroflexota bacterium]|nr:hypothetical protein [Chloroflexota bacterium]
MDGTRALPDRVPLGVYFLERLEHLLALPASAIAARGEPGLALVEWALRSTFGDCRAIGCAQEAALLLLAAAREPFEALADGRGA